jgi:hypothetical protein
MRKLTGALAFMLAATPAVAGMPNSEALDDFEGTGEKVHCVEMRSADITPIDESTFLFRSGTGTWYLNRTRSACNDADSRFSRLDIKLFNTQLCSGEILRVVDRQSGIFQGSCALGDFERLAKKADSE